MVYQLIVEHIPVVLGHGHLDRQVPGHGDQEDKGEGGDPQGHHQALEESGGDLPA